MLRIFLNVVIICSLLIATSCQDCDIDIVVMDKDTMPQVFQSAEGWYSSIVNNKTSDKSKLFYTYQNTLNGFSASFTDEELQSIRISKGYISSIKDRPGKLLTTRTPNFLGLNYGYGAWPASNFGEGIIIGLLDTGIWPESPSFSGHGMAPIPSKWKGECEKGTMFNSSMCNRKLIGARHFSKGIFAADPNVTITMNSTRDTDGHGTHTSSIAAGNYVDGASSFEYASGMARGMAPRAAIAMYKVAFVDQLTCLSDYLAAIDQAIADGVDILSISLAFEEDHPEGSPLTAATFAAMEKGIFISMAAGNTGNRGLGNDYPWVTIVGASTLDRAFYGTLILGNGVSIQGYACYSGKLTNQQLPIVFSKNCSSMLQQRNIIVCQKSPERVSNFADGIVYIMSDPAREFMKDYWSEYCDIPALFVSTENGNILLEYINKTTHPTGSIYFQVTSVGIKPAPMVWNKSSRGPSTNFPSIPKPDVIAPGVNVLGAWIPNTPKIGHETKNNTGFTFETGTSMACPHVAGVAALLKKAHPEWSPAAIRSAIMTTADILDNTNNPIRDETNGQPATPMAMGSGLLNPNRALDPGLIYDITREDYIDYLCALNWTTNQIKAVVRSNHFNCSHPNQDLNYPSFIAYINTTSSSPTRYVFHRTVTNVGETGSRYFAELTTLKGLNLSVQPQYLEFHDKFQKQNFNLTIEAPTALESPVVSGYLSWVNLRGTQVVRSPIVATTHMK